MILVDTSVWVDHLRRSLPGLRSALEAGEVLGHPWVVGEIALGGLRPGSEVLGALGRLPQAVVATDAEVLALVRDRELAGRGIGWVDAGLLASALLTPATRIWTADRRLADAAAALGVGAAAG